MYRKVKIQKVEQNFYPGLALISFQEPGPGL